jgi:hypothetical protein
MQTLGERLKENYDRSLGGARDEPPTGSCSPHRQKVEESVLWLLKKL